MRRRNILLLLADQHRGDWMPFRPEEFLPAGGPLPLRMPNIRRLMDRGTSFTRAVTDSPLCVPARACLALGQGYDRCGAWNNDFCCPLDRDTVYRVLRDGGYEVSGTGKFDLHKPIMYWGEAGWIPQLGRLGFTRGRENEGKGDAVWAARRGRPGPYGVFLRERGLLEAYCEDHLRRAEDPEDSAAAPIPAEAYADNYVTANALAELQALAEQEKPWFLTVNFSGPHDPWDVTGEMKAAWAGVRFPLPAEYKGDKDRLLDVRRNYGAMLENIDRNIGVLLDALRRLGQEEDTVVIYTADHGGMLGDRNRFFKSVPYEPAVHIPLVFSGRGVLPGHVCRELAQLSDLAASIADLAGLAMPEGTEARSLLPLASREDAPPVRERQYSALYPRLWAGDACPGGYEGERRFWKRPVRRTDPLRGCGAWRSVSDRVYKYIEFLDTGREALYNLQEDPGETRNLAGELPDLTSALRELLAERPLPEDWGERRE